MPFKDRKDKQKFQRDWLQKRKDDFFKGKKCRRCGSTKDLQLHHTDPSKKVDHKIWSWKPERFREEVRKCIILCKSCHQKDKFSH